MIWFMEGRKESVNHVDLGKKKEKKKKGQNKFYRQNSNWFTDHRFLYKSKMFPPTLYM